MKKQLIDLFLVGIILLGPLNALSQEKEEEPPTLYETLSWVKEKIESMDLKDLVYKGDRIFYEEFAFVDCECKVDFSGLKMIKDPEGVQAHRTIYHFDLAMMDKVIQSVELEEQIDLMTEYRAKKILINKSVEFTDYGWKDYPSTHFAQVGLPVADSALRSDLIDRFNYAIELCGKKKRKK